MNPKTLSILTSVKLPRNQTAAMQLLQLYIQSGHFYWTSGTVLVDKFERFIDKLSFSRIDRDAPGRAYDKSKGIASIHLVVFSSTPGIVDWILVSTAGREGLADPSSPSIGIVRDTRLNGQHLGFKHYELLHLEKKIVRIRDITTKTHEVLKNRKETIRQTTWTWRITPARFKEHEAFIVSLIKHRDTRGLVAELDALSMMPLFSGVRGQVLKLYAEASKLAAKFKLTPVTPPTLPYLTKLPIYHTPSKNLLAILYTDTAQVENS